MSTGYLSRGEWRLHGDRDRQRDLTPHRCSGGWKRNIYIADGKSGDVYKETLRPNGSYAQTTVAGGLAGPQGVAVAGGGNLYITGSTGGEIYREALQPNGSNGSRLCHAGHRAKRDWIDLGCDADHAARLAKPGRGGFRDNDHRDR